MNDWATQHAFLTILRHGSLSAAARALGVTQPTMRRRLDALEAATGPLFTRTPTGLVPTEAARALAQHAEAMEHAASAFTRAASADATASAGTVRLTASDVMGAEVLPGLLAPLQAQHPALAIELHLSNKTQDLLHQEADIAVRMVRPAQGALVARPVGGIRIGLFAHRAYLAARGIPDTLADLPRHALIGPDRDTADLVALRAYGFDLERGMFTTRTDSQLAQWGAIRAGCGIGFCQAALAARQPDLVAVLPNAFTLHLQTWIVMHADLRRVARVRTLFDHLVRTVGAYARLEK